MGEAASLAAADAAVRHLSGLLSDVWLTVDAPDFVGGRWRELCRGSSVSPVFVCVDAMSNVLHVQYLGPENLSIVYLPGWYYEVATAAALGRPLDPSAVTVLDFATARPLAFDLAVEHRVRGGAETVALPSGRGTVEYAPLAFGYAFAPARGFGITHAAPGTDPATDPTAIFHWSAMALRVAAAPGVTFAQRPLLGETALNLVRAAYRPNQGTITCDQTLAFEFERHRSPRTLPPLGAPLRPVPMAEPDLVANAVALVGARDQPRPVAVQETCSDGVDLVLLKPDLRRLPQGTPWGWQPNWLVEAAKAVDEAVFAMLMSLLDTYVQWLGGLPETAPVSIRIRVDPASGEDRFAYRLDFLDPDGEVSAEPPDETTTFAPCFRLTVVRTKNVHVILDVPLGAAGESDLDGIVQYREKVVAHVDDVPLLIADGEVETDGQLEARSATIEEIVHIALVVGEFVPFPPLQAMYDLRDLGSVASYVLTGKGLYGEPMSGVEAAITLGGVLVPEVAERAFGSLLASGRRVTTLGDDPTRRLREAAEAAVPDDAALATSLIERVEGSP
ncbi:hypothetical protein NIE79_005062 [Micromonospora sp. NIE79]|uniref:Uncharacterized protein n=1 Tax=Micromonospora trifolii TaxID=2911208 RepID=A0ABS9MWC6_9ACTN|nr:hypothetical protein [Micromonospora trifolii]MCG5442006.1 hypothetical protein [Micromonospora trifolii]